MLVPMLEVTASRSNIGASTLNSNVAIDCLLYRIEVLHHNRSCSAASKSNTAFEYRFSSKFKFQHTSEHPCSNIRHLAHHRHSLTPTFEYPPFNIRQQYE